METKNTVINEINDFLKNIKKEDIEYGHEIDENSIYYLSEGHVKLPVELSKKICNELGGHLIVENSCLRLKVNMNCACIVYSDSIAAKLTEKTPYNFYYIPSGPFFKKYFKPEDFDKNAVNKAISVCNELFAEKENNFYQVEIDKELADKLNVYYDDNVSPAIRIMKYDNSIISMSAGVDENNEIIFKKVKDFPNYTWDTGERGFDQEKFYYDTKDFLDGFKMSIGSNGDYDNDKDSDIDL